MDKLASWQVSKLASNKFKEPRAKSQELRAAMLIGLLVMVMAAGTALARSFAIMSPEDYAACEAQGWTLPPPVWKPDSTAVLCDKPGNVDFSDAERLTLDSLGAVIIDADTVSAWMQAEGWIQEVEE